MNYTIFFFIFIRRLKHWGYPDLHMGSDRTYAEETWVCSWAYCEAIRYIVFRVKNSAVRSWVSLVLSNYGGEKDCK